MCVCVYNYDYTSDQIKEESKKYLKKWEEKLGDSENFQIGKIREKYKTKTTKQTKKSEKKMVKQVGTWKYLVKHWISENLTRWKSTE